MSTGKKPIVAFIHPDLGIGGAERLVLDVAGALKNQNYEVYFVTNHFDPSHAFQELKDGEYHVEVVGDWLPRSVFGKCQALCAYIRMVYLSLVFVFFCQTKVKPDLCFTDLIPVAVPFLKLAKMRVVYYCHHPDLLASPPGGMFKKLYRTPINWIEYKTTAMADIILVNSEYTAAVFRKTFPNIAKSIQVLYPTIAKSYHESVENETSQKHISDIVPEVTSKEKDLKVFLSLNRFHPFKRLEFAIEAMNYLRALSTTQEWSKTFCIIAGGYDPLSQANKEYFNFLTTLVKKEHLEDKIVFVKSPSDEAKADLLRNCTALLYTPLKEHFGIVPLEAMLVSKPVIAMNSGGPRETVEHGVTGYLCDSTKDMAEFMQKIVKCNMCEMGIKGRKRLKENFSYDKFSKELTSIVSFAISIK